MDCDLDGLPLIDIEQHPPGFETVDGDPDNGQTRELFASEAAAVVAATTQLRWVAPSRDEDPTGPLDAASVPRIVIGGDDEPAADEVVAVQGGRERGLVIHKLFEEVLTGETGDDRAALVDRAADLIRDLGRELSTDSANGLSAEEMAGTVTKTLALPDIAAVRSKLVPELPVYGSGEDDGVELATFGIVDALAIGEDGSPELVIDWKSDVNPSARASDHYRSQVRRYLAVTGIPKGMVVFVTTGSILPVSASVSN